VFDVTSANAPAAYRLYGGAFARTPDEVGFRFWASKLDEKASLRSVAAEFINSGEFIGRYGSSLSNAAFVDALYQNVLSRGADAGGVAYWNDVLNKQLTDRASVLVEFTQLPEFVGISAANISNGYWVV
jgi:serralysin